MSQDVDLGERGHRIRRIGRLAAIGGERNFQGAPPRFGGLRQRAVVELRSGKLVEQRQQMRALGAAAVLLGGQRAAQPAHQPAIGGEGALGSGERAKETQDGNPPRRSQFCHSRSATSPRTATLPDSAYVGMLLSPQKTYD